MKMNISGLHSFGQIFFSRIVSNNEPVKAGEFDDFEIALYANHGVQPPVDDHPQCRSRKNALPTQANTKVTSKVEQEYFSKCDEEDEINDITRVRVLDMKTLHPLSHVDFISDCANVAYDEASDTLSCNHGTRTIVLRDPHSCSNIRITTDKQLLCFQ